MLYDGHDAPVGHIPYQDLPVFGHTTGQEQAIVVREIDEGHTVVVLRQPEEQRSFLEAPDNDVGILSPLTRGDISDESGPVRGPRGLIMQQCRSAWPHKRIV